MELQKPVHTLILDTGAIIKNEPPVSTLLKECEALISVPAVISEITDAATRSRVETTLKPFLTLKTPSPNSLKVVTDFARRTGDLAVLSKPDLQLIALTYEVECERNGGDWRLRRVPGQKRLNGAPPTKDQDEESVTGTTEFPDGESVVEEQSAVEAGGAETASNEAELQKHVLQESAAPETTSMSTSDTSQIEPSQDDEVKIDGDIDHGVANLTVNDDQEEVSEESPKVDSAHNSADSQADSDSDSEGWITPSNLKRKQAKDATPTTTQAPEPKTMQAAILTTDFAMQNVILQMNLNLLSPSLTRVKHLKTFVLRCHACFQVTKDMSKQFCPKCGQPSLTRVSCSTNANGEFKLHLKKNMQWNHRGDRYSIPKPMHGSASGKVRGKGGGKDGWGNDLILAEDQKEYQKAVSHERRLKERNLMDEDYLPSILTGDRRGGGGKIKVGAGRNVNSRKR